MFLHNFLAYIMLQQKTTVIDFNSLLSCGDISQSLVRRTTANEQRAYSFFANTGLHPKASIQSLRQSLQRQLSNQIFFMFRPIFNDGFRTANLSRQLKRCRNLLASLRRQTISLWLSRENFSKYFSRCKRKEKLANISRFCSVANNQSQTTLCGRRLWHYIKKYCLRLRCNRNRLMSFTVSLGSTSQAQKCCKASYTNGPERLYTYVHTHYKRCCTRNHRLSHYASGAAGHIRHGQRLYRFCNIIQFFKEQLFLCYSSKKENSLLSQVFSSDRQNHWFAKRPDNKVDRAENFKTLPDTTKANQFSRRRSASNFCVPDQQFSVGRVNNLPALQTALADRTFLQVDQTALANKVFLRYFYQRCQDSNLDSDQCICACSNNSQGVEVGAFVTRNTPNPEHLTFRENLAKTSTYGKLLYYKRATKLQPTVVIRLMTGQY